MFRTAISVGFQTSLCKHCKQQWSVSRAFYHASFKKQDEDELGSFDTEFRVGSMKIFEIGY